MKDLLIRTATGISLIVLVFGSILLGSVPFLLVITAVYILSIRELLKLQPATPSRKSILSGLSGSLLFLMVYLTIQYQVNLLWFLLPAGIWMAGYLSGGSYRFSLLALLWLALPLVLFYIMGWLTEDPDYQPVLPLSVIALVWINDTFAFLIGKYFGKHQMTPLLSPGKTWEGFIGGLFFTLLGGWLVFTLTELFYPLAWLLFSLIISVFGFWGDLFESRLKREVNLKNTGGLLPGHGGILDRFDSLFFATPPVFMVILLMRYLSL